MANGEAVVILPTETPITGLPDGLVARSVQKIRTDTKSWRQVRDRRHRQRLDAVVLMTPHPRPTTSSASSNQRSASAPEPAASSWEPNAGHGEPSRTNSETTPCR